MSAHFGYNPMRWDCKADGCFNEKRRPKIEVFAECFPRRINFGDVDGLVELNGYFCMLEWKGDGGSVKTGQQITYERFTQTLGNVVFVVGGDAQTMEVNTYQIFWRGQSVPPVPCDLAELKERLSNWVQWTDAGARKSA